MSDRYIVIFNDDVSKEEIEKEVTALELAGGEIRYAWFRDVENGIGINGFAATIPPAFLETFKGLQPDKILSIEPDGIATIQDEERAPLVGS